MKVSSRTIDGIVHIYVDGVDIATVEVDARHNGTVELLGRGRRLQGSSEDYSRPEIDSWFYASKAVDR